MTSRVVIVSLLLLPACAHVGPKRSKPLAAKTKVLDRYVREQLRKLSLLGLSVAVVHEGKTLLSRGYGKRTLRGTDAVRADTLFGIGSVTKQFICAAALLLAEKGKLSLDDPVGKYFPRLPHAEEIHLIDLFSHQSGYEDYYPLDFTDRRMMKPITADAIIRRYASGKLQFAPRTRYSYSNTGYIIAGRVLEKVSGERLGALLERLIFRPLGLTHTRYVPKREGPELAEGAESFFLGPLEPAAYEARGWLGAAGGIYSTAADLVKWDLALVGGKILKPASLERMTRPRYLPGGRRSFYACGIGVRNRRGHTVLGHNGSVAGFLAFNAVVPVTRSAVAVLSNLQSYSHVATVHGKLLQAVLPKPEAPRPGTPKVAGPPPDKLVRVWFRRFQAGKIDRAALSPQFSAFLTPARVREAAARLKAWGEPSKVKVKHVGERGGLEMAVIDLSFGKRSLEAWLYRSPDGKIHQLLFSRP